VGEISASKVEGAAKMLLNAEVYFCWGIAAPRSKWIRCGDDGVCTLDWALAMENIMNKHSTVAELVRPRIVLLMVRLCVKTLL